MSKRISASKLTGSSKAHETRWYIKGKRDRFEEHKKVIDDFQINCSENYETYIEEPDEERVGQVSLRGISQA